MLYLLKGLGKTPAFSWVEMCRKGCKTHHIYFGKPHEDGQIICFHGKCSKHSSRTWRWEDNQPGETVRLLKTINYLKEVVKNGIDSAGVFAHTRVPVYREAKWNLRFITVPRTSHQNLRIAMAKRTPGLWDEPKHLPKNISDMICGAPKESVFIHGLIMLDHKAAAAPRSGFTNPEFHWDHYSHDDRKYQATLKYRELYLVSAMWLVNSRAAEAALKNPDVLLDALCGRL